MKPRFFIVLCLYVFICLTANAQNPTLWGMTSAGGTHNLGTIFSYDISTQAYTVKHSFGDGNDGQMPMGSLIQASNGLLYGMTSKGGDNNLGTIFSIDPASGVENVIHSFTQWGNMPFGSLIQVDDSMLYGMTTYGGPGNGTIFRYNINSSRFLYVHDFIFDSDGLCPFGSLLRVNDSLFYAVLRSGFIIKFNFHLNTGEDKLVGNSGESFCTLIKANNGLVYGTTLLGGNSDGIFVTGQGLNPFVGAGNIFSIDPVSDSVNYIYDQFGADNAGAVFPYGSLMQAKDSLLYGLAMGCGPVDTISSLPLDDYFFSSGGAIYSYNIYNNQFVVLHHFNTDSDGQSPKGALIQANNGLLYGMTLLGGIHDSGTIFSYNTLTGIETVLHHFSGEDGAKPSGDLLEVDHLPTGIGQALAENNKLLVSPNPSDGIFTIQFLTEQNNYPVEVFTILGEKILEQSGYNGNYRCDLSNQPAGLYFIYLKTETGIVSEKIMINK